MITARTTPKRRRPKGRLGAAVAILALLAVLAALTAPSLGSVRPADAAPGDGQSRTGNPAWGLYAPDLPGSLATVDAVQRAVGGRARYLMWYVHWIGPASQPDAAQLAVVEANGSIPVITWMSDDPSNRRAVDDQLISSGGYDGYIATWADALKAFGHPVLLRFDEEMNGDWYGWSANDSQSSGAYVNAFRHVHDVFAAVGATNVAFVWSPNVDYRGSASLKALYPGDSYVDYVGVDGYNWGPLAGHHWQSPEQVFDQTIAQLRSITKRPILITEVGSTPVGGNKATWIEEFFRLLEKTPAIQAFIWFDMDKETDWRINSSPAAMAAFMAGAERGRRLGASRLVS